MKSSLRCFAVLAAFSVCLGSAISLHAQTGSTVAAAPSAAAQSPEATPALSATFLTIPGPRRSFLRMAGISQKVSTEEVLPLLARNIVTHGYQGSRPTEFLVLLNRYVHQAQELTALAGPEEVIRVSGCPDATPLLRILGYRLRQDCGKSNASLVTGDPERAFLTIDSGFPLPELEQTLQGGKGFSYPYRSFQVPLMFSESDWTNLDRSAHKETRDLLSALLHDPALARLYWAVSRTDAATRDALRQSVGLDKLMPVGSALDFYGSHICIRSGRVIVPGGAAAEPVWKDLAGANPGQPQDFVPHLLTKDKGWLVAYFDAVARLNQAQQQHLLDLGRLKRYYQAFRSTDPSMDASRPAFRPAPALLLLMTRLQWDANGQPYVPGNLDVWKEILRNKAGTKLIRDWGKRSTHWTEPEQLLDAMFALSRMESENGPVQIYLTLSELDSKRAPENRLPPQTVKLLASRFSDFSEQYLIFSEFPGLSDASLVEFVNVASSITAISNHTLRGNTMGMFQGELGVWQILARQGQIPKMDLSASWQAVLKPFAKISSSGQLFEAGRTGLGEILRAATGKPTATQDEIIDLLAGPSQTTPEGEQMHQEIANRMRAVLDGQRLVSLDTVLALGNGLDDMAHGAKVADEMLPLAGELREFEMPRPIFTSGERTEWAAGTYNNRHTELQMHTDLSKVFKSPASVAQIEEARGQLAPFFRDTVVGLNYAYYEPPGAQVLHINPLFVRSHDFAGETVVGIERVWQAPLLFGEGSPAGGGAHLVGSLADLPYVLAEVEQDFIAPENVQALIWREFVPGLLINATLPRWWNVSRNELHAVALYQRAGEELLTAAAGNAELRSRVMNILADRMTPDRLELLEQALQAQRLGMILPRLMPADTFYLAVEYRRRFPGESDSWGAARQELEALNRQAPSEVGWERLSRDFGVPHPILAQSYARELLNVKPFPAFEGYSSRLLAESWDSSNLYWARLADEKGYSPVLLNRVVPELTRRMIEKIFATDFEDWPAVLRAMRETGEEFKEGKIASLTANTISQP